jgi:hypothetical protein
MEGWSRHADVRGVIEPTMPNRSKQPTKPSTAREIHLDSTAGEVLKTLVGVELVDALLPYHTDKEMYSTYLRALVTEQHSEQRPRSSSSTSTGHGSRTSGLEARWP